MAWAHTTGEAASIAAWFAIFEAWIRDTVGWTIEAGAGTTDLIIRSVSEAGGLTLLWARVWQATTHIHVELRDDLAGTHVTTRGEFVETDGVPFVYWLTGDMDAFVIVAKAGRGYTFLYAGLVEPFALTVPDETYRMVVTGQWNAAATILRHHTGAWDQDDNSYCADYLRDHWFDQLDQCYAVSGIYFADHADIAGQFYHVSCYQRASPSINPEDKLISDWSADAEWTWFRQAGVPTGELWALHTAGTLPVGQPDGLGFAHQRGNTATPLNFFDTVLPNFLTGIGWVVDNQPASAYMHDKRCFSTGESGNELIWCSAMMNNAAPDQIGVGVQDDAARTHFAARWSDFDALDFPANYWISGDLDCFIFTLDRAGTYAPWWTGMAVTNTLNAPSTPYKLFCSILASSFILRGHTGTWVVFNYGTQDDFTPATLSNPNAYDGTTYLAWPIMFYFAGGLNPFTLLNSWGRFKYMFRTHGGAIAVGDSITWGAQSYTMFTAPGGQDWLMRADVIEPINFPGRRLYPLSPYMSQWIDSGWVQKNPQTAVIRGDTVEPFNVKLRGAGVRIDEPR